MFRAADPDAALILLHIPKTAGTTLSIILMKKFGEDATRAVTGGPIGRNAFASEPESVRGAPRLFIGHQSFGMHQHIPRPCEYVTVVRDPVARVISHYHHVRNEPNHYMHRYTLGQRLTLEQYAANPIKTDELDNGQTRMLADYALSQSVPIGRPERSLLDSAIANLERSFCCVGLTERFDETMVLLTDALGWERVPGYLPARVSANKPKEPPSQSVVDTIREFNALDVELYDWVAQRLEERVRSLGEGFMTRVEAVRSENRRIAEMLRGPTSFDGDAMIRR